MKGRAVLRKEVSHLRHLVHPNRLQSCQEPHEASFSVTTGRVSLHFALRAVSVSC